SAAELADVVGGIVSAVVFPERGTFWPTTYPIANATPQSSTTIKNPTSRCRSPTTSSNSPVSLFFMSRISRLGCGAIGCYLGQPSQTCNYIDWQWKHDGRILFGADLHQRLQISQLNRDRLLLDNLGGHRQFLRRRVLALGVNDLGAAFALCFRLPRDRADHLLGQIDLLDFHHRHLHAPCRRVLVQDCLQAHIQLFPLAQQLIELDLSE